MDFGFIRGRAVRAPHKTVEPPDGTQAEVFLLLRRAFESRCLLTVQVGPERIPYTSAILEVVHDERYLVLDELTPISGHERIQTDPRIEVRALVDGRELRFASRVTQISEQDGLPYYKVAFPSEIAYAQRRRQLRVPVPMNQGFETIVAFDDRREWRGELRDLSVGGLCARIRSGDIDPNGDRHARALCRITLAEHRAIVSDIEILHIDAPARHRVPRIGARFVDPAPALRRRIERFCAELDRLRVRLR